MKRFLKGFLVAGALVASVQAAKVELVNTISAVHDGYYGFYINHYVPFDGTDKSITSTATEVVDCSFVSLGASVDCKDFNLNVYEQYQPSYQTIGIYGQLDYFIGAYQTKPDGATITLKTTVNYIPDNILEFDPSDKSINLYFENVLWADIHLIINGGAQLNYRMTKDGDIFSQVITQALENGDVIDYYTTYQPVEGPVAVSEWQSVTVSGLVDLLTTTVEGQTLHLAANENLDWVDVHYTINGSSQYNYRMTGAQKTFSFEIPQTLAEGDVVSYWYTYSLAGRAADSKADVFTYGAP